MTYDEMSTLAARMAVSDAIRELIDMNVPAAAAERRVAQHVARETQNWLNKRGAMFDALATLERLGYTVTDAQSHEG